MSDFDYLSVLISIVLGLGIANILSGLAGIVRHRHRVVMYWPLVITLITLFLVHVQTWWTMFGLRNVREWTIQGFMIVLMQPVLLYLASVMVVPEFAGNERIDLKREFFRDRTWYYGSLVVIIVFSILRPVVLTGSLPDHGDLIAQFFFGLTFLLGFASPNETVQKLIPPVMLAFFVVYTVALFVNLNR